VSAPLFHSRNLRSAPPNTFYKFGASSVQPLLNNNIINMADNRLSTISRPSWATDNAVLEKILSPVQDGEDFAFLERTASHKDAGKEETYKDPVTQKLVAPHKQTEAAGQFDQWYMATYGPPGGKEPRLPAESDRKYAGHNLSDALDDDIVVVDCGNRAYRRPDARHEPPTQHLQLFNRSTQQFVGSFHQEEHIINMRQRQGNAREMISESSLGFFFEIQDDFIRRHSRLVRDAVTKRKEISLHNNGFWQVIHLPSGEAPIKEGRTPKPTKGRGHMSPQELAEADAWLREQDGDSLRHVRAIVTVGTTLIVRKYREKVQRKRMIQDVQEAFERSVLAKESALGLGALTLSNPAPTITGSDENDDDGTANDNTNSSLRERNTFTAGPASSHGLSPTMTRDTRFRSSSKVNTLPNSKSIGFHLHSLMEH